MHRQYRTCPQEYDLRSVSPPETGQESTNQGPSVATTMNVRLAYEKVADLMRPSPWIYWPDLLVSSLLGWTCLWKMTQAPAAIAVGYGVVAVLALFRALSFVHELTHLRKGALPGFRLAWNLLVGLPMLLPSYFYVPVHLEHHNPKIYGTEKDPEYLPLAGKNPLLLLLFVAAAVLAPVALLLRWLVLAPLSLVSPRLRRLTFERCSALQINPAYVRGPATTPSEHQEQQLQEVFTCLFAWSCLSALWTGWLPFALLPGWLLVLSGMATLNQLRTLLAHRWESEHGAGDLEHQLLDSVNYHNPLYELWAPVGLRYHALHHYLPGLPYHSLPEAHRRLRSLQPFAEQYQRTEATPASALSRLLNFRK